MMAKAPHEAYIIPGSPMRLEVHDVPDDTALLEYTVIAHRDGCAILSAGPCDCRPPTAATSTRTT